MRDDIRIYLNEGKYSEAVIKCKELLALDNNNPDLWYSLFLSENGDYFTTDFSNGYSNELSFNKALENASRRKSAEYMSEYNFYKSISKCNGLNKLFRYAQYGNVDEFYSYYIKNINNIVIKIDENELHGFYDNLDYITFNAQGDNELDLCTLLVNLIYLELKSKELLDMLNVLIERCIKSETKLSPYEVTLNLNDLSKKVSDLYNKYKNNPDQKNDIALENKQPKPEVTPKKVNKPKGRYDYTVIDAMYKARNWSKVEELTTRITEEDPKESKAWLLQGVAIAWQANTVRNRFDEANICFELALKYSDSNEFKEYTNVMRETYDDIFYAYITLLASNIGETRTLMVDVGDIEDGYFKIEVFLDYYYLETITTELSYDYDERNKKEAEYLAFVNEKYLEAAKEIYLDIKATYEEPFSLGNKPTGFNFDYYRKHIDNVYQVLGAIKSKSSIYLSDQGVLNSVIKAVDFHIEVLRYNVEIKSYTEKLINDRWHWVVDEIMADSSKNAMNKKVDELLKFKKQALLENTWGPRIDKLKLIESVISDNCEDILKEVNLILINCTDKGWAKTRLEKVINRLHTYYQNEYRNRLNKFIANFEETKTGSDYYSVISLLNEVNAQGELKVAKGFKKDFKKEYDEFFKVLEPAFFENFPEEGNKIRKTREEAEHKRLKSIYDSNIVALESSCLIENAQDKFDQAINNLENIISFEDTKGVIEKYKAKRQEYLDNLANEREKTRKKRRNIIIIIISAIVSLIIFIIVFLTVIKPSMDYNKAIDNIASGDVIEAEELLESLDNYKDSSNLLHLVQGVQKINGGDLLKEGPKSIFETGGTITLNFVNSNEYELSGFEDVNDYNFTDYNDYALHMGNLRAHKDGEEFYGWSLDSTKISYENGQWNVDINIYPSFEYLTYNIYYDEGVGGITLPSSCPKLYDITQTFTLPNLEKEGYEFLGWSDDNGETYTKDYTFDKTFGDKWLKAIWQGNTYTITFDPNGGSMESTTMDVIYGSSYSLPKASKEGYEFTGWSGTSMNGTWELAENVTLTATFSIVNYEITYPQDIISYSSGKITSFNVEKIQTIPNAIRDGYKFLGWTCEGVDTPTINLTTEGLYTDINLVAHFEGVKSTVTFDTNGGEYKDESIEISYNEKFDLDIPTKRGYKFKYWSDGNKIYNSETEYTWQYTSNKTLEAVWEVETYNIEYVLNGGDQYNIETYEYSETNTVAINNPTKTGYTFTGWKVNDGEEVIDYIISADTVGDLKLEATWTANTYIITFDANGGEFDIESDEFTYDLKYILSAPTKTGYTFNYWSYNGKNYPANSEIVFDISEDATLVASYTANVYKLTTYYMDYYTYEIKSETKDCTYGELFSAYGNSNVYNYKFTPKGYYTEENGEGDLICTSQTSSVDIWNYTEDITLYGHFVYNVNYYENNGNVIKKEFNYNQTPEDYTPVKDGLTFGGWYTNGKLESEVDFAYIPGNTSFYAKWEEEISASLLGYGSNYISSVKEDLVGDVIIPTYINGNLITKISSGAFKDQVLLTSIVIPDTVTSIGEGAFEGCVNLESITLPFVGSSIDDTTAKTNTLGHIFGYYAERSGTYKTSDTVEYTTQSYVKTSGAYVYYNAYYIPESLKTVTVTMQQSIPAYAFANCDLLEKVTIPSNVISIGQNAFYNCGGIKQFNSNEDGLFNIPLSITEINKSAFNGCSLATEFTMSNNITSISDYAFKGCVKVIRFNSDSDGILNVPTYCESIGIDAFNGMESITDINIGNNVATIGEGAFEGFSSLVNIVVPFVGSSISDTTAKTNTLGHIFGYYAEKSGVFKTSETVDYTSQSYTKTSGAYVYYNTYYIPESLRTVTVTMQQNIPAYAFANCDLLETITLLENSDISQTKTFSNCTATVSQTLEIPVNIPWDGSTIATSFASGDGSQNNPYIINNGSELAYLKNQVNNGTNYEDTYFKLGYDINLSNNEFGVIGNTSSTTFKGNLNGDGHVIKNFTITSSDLYCGLFGYVEGDILNLGVINVTITHTSEVSDKVYVGLLAGYQTGNISNVYTVGTITANTKGTSYAGGLVGFASGTIKDSYSNVVVSLTSSNMMSYVGGLVGEASGTIDSSFAYGNVTSKGVNSTYSYVGGLVGNNNATITNSYRYSNQVITKYTTKDLSSNTAGISAEFSEIFEYISINWDDDIWDFSKLENSLPVYLK